VVGFVNNGSAGSFVSHLAEFRKGIAGAGIADGHVVIETRWAEGNNSRLPGLMQELVQRRVDVIAATGGTATPLAAKAASGTVPIVFAIGGDPIKFGLVVSLNRPGGNITGASFLANALLPKQFEVLHEAVAKETIIGFLVNPTNPNAEPDIAIVTSAAAKLGRKLIVVKATAKGEIDAALVSLAHQKAGALLIFPDALFTGAFPQLLAHAKQQKLPTLYNSRDFALAGGLIGYGADQMEAYRFVGSYVGRILKGEKPAELPVMQSTAVELIVNLDTAKALGIEIPQTLLARADRIIE
jgi:putative ABC transport system substrate-binding protein